MWMSLCPKLQEVSAKLSGCSLEASLSWPNEKSMLLSLPPIEVGDELLLTKLDLWSVNMFHEIDLAHPFGTWEDFDHSCTMHVLWGLLQTSKTTVELIFDIFLDMATKTQSNWVVVLLVTQSKLTLVTSQHWHIRNILSISLNNFHSCSS